MPLVPGLFGNLSGIYFRRIKELLSVITYKEGKRRVEAI